jgi:hypothetical protein
MSLLNINKISHSSCIQMRLPESLLSRYGLMHFFKSLIFAIALAISTPVLSAGTHKKYPSFQSMGIRPHCLFMVAQFLW